MLSTSRGQGVGFRRAGLGALMLLALAAGPASAQRGGRVDREAAAPVTTLNREVLEEINAARTSPGEYLRKLPGGSEAQAFMRQQMPLAPLAYSPRLGAAAARHLADQGPLGGVSHVGSDGSHPMDRVQAAGAYSMTVAEEISVSQTSAQGVVMQLIIDQGVVGKPHRMDVFDPNLQFGGVACGPNARFRIMCVIDMSARIMVPGGDAPRTGRP
jgi:hypothetical protein